MISKKVCVVTGSRADYGLLYWLMKEIDVDKEFMLQIVVTGMHLSKRFGNTYQEIKKDGFSIDKKVNMSPSTDSEIEVSKSMGLGMIGFSDAFNELRPDLLLVLGDRFEIFSAVSVAMVARIPVVHLHGGETTEGAFDEYIRHSITKMSHLHFTATDIYRNRVIQLGEDPKRVFNVGGLGIENIKRLALLSCADLEKKINFKFAKRNILVTYHPVTLENSSSEIQFNELLESINVLKNTTVIFTKSNSDPSGEIINLMIDNYVSSHNNCISFTSMGQLNYLSALQFVDVVVGNSSSGLIEAPSFRIGTIDIGDRQRGRIKASSVVECLPNKKSISTAFDKVFSENFQNIISKVKNPYDSGNIDTSKEIIKIMKKINFKNILKKSFYNLKVD